MKGNRATIIVLALVCAGVSCRKEEVKAPEPDPPPLCDCSYSGQVRPFVLLKCAVSGCHVGAFPFGDFSQYAPLKQRVDNGRVRKLVFEEKLMPPSGKPPLTQAEMETLRKWMDNGAPDD